MMVILLEADSSFCFVLFCYLIDLNFCVKNVQYLIFISSNEKLKMALYHPSVPCISSILITNATGSVL